MEIKFDQNNDGIVNDEEAEFYMSGNESYERDTFIDNGWPLMKPALTEEEQAENTESTEVPSETSEGEDLDEDPIGDDEDDEEDEEDYEDDEEASHVRKPPDTEDVADEGTLEQYDSENGEGR